MQLSLVLLLLLQNPWKFLEKEVIIIKRSCVDVLTIKLDTCYVSSIRPRNSTRENTIYQSNCVTNKKFRGKLFCHYLFRVRKRLSQSVLPRTFSTLKSCLLWVPHCIYRFVQSLLNKILFCSDRSQYFKSNLNNVKNWYWC